MCNKILTCSSIIYTATSCRAVATKNRYLKRLLCISSPVRRKYRHFTIPCQSEQLLYWPRCVTRALSMSQGNRYQAPPRAVITGTTTNLLLAKCCLHRAIVSCLVDGFNCFHVDGFLSFMCFMISVYLCSFRGKSFNKLRDSEIRLVSRQICTSKILNIF